MLSIIIPSYNYPVYELVKELFSQCTSLAFPFEIIVRDDCSKNQYNNFSINKLSNCTYTISNKNRGLAQTRNYLITQAQYAYVLLLDNDVFPQNNDFIKIYLNAISCESSIYYGGIAYKKEIPSNSDKLRWVYGISREEQTATERLTKNESSFLSSNTLFSKHIFDVILYDDAIINYGYEDLVFSKLAFKNNLKVKHLDNPVWHLKLDTSETYLQKTETALKTLKILIEENKLDYNDTGITRNYLKIEKTHLFPVLLFISNLFGIPRILKKNLISKTPKLNYFDWYRLLYFANLMKR